MTQAHLKQHGSYYWHIPVSFSSLSRSRLARSTEQCTYLIYPSSFCQNSRCTCASNLSSCLSCSCTYFPCFAPFPFSCFVFVLCTAQGRLWQAYQTGAHCEGVLDRKFHHQPDKLTVNLQLRDHLSAPLEKSSQIEYTTTLLQNNPNYFPNLPSRDKDI